MKQLSNLWLISPNLKGIKSYVTKSRSTVPPKMADKVSTINVIQYNPYKIFCHGKPVNDIMFLLSVSYFKLD